VQASQQWWLDTCVAADGLPEYDHPYSSGLDDSPVFDTDLPVATPDLAAYLAVQDRQLADLLTRLGDEPAAVRHRARAADSERALLRLWDADHERFAARGAHGRVAAHTVVDLLPLLTGTLPHKVAHALVAELSDPKAFGSPFRVPTVAVGDPAFNGDRMWRGPVWVNTNWLLIEGLLASGYAAQAVQLAHRTLAMVAAAGGAFEYYHPVTGLRAGRAAPAFAWTAALIVDLSVRFGAEFRLTRPDVLRVF
jgi:glycogen debranching enzyme